MLYSSPEAMAAKVQDMCTAMAVSPRQVGKMASSKPRLLTCNTEALTVSVGGSICSGGRQWAACSVFLPADMQHRSTEGKHRGLKMVCWAAVGRIQPVRAH